MEQHRFLDRVRASLETGRGEARRPAPAPYRPPAPPPADELAERLCREAAEAGSFVHRAGSPDEARGLILQILQQLDARRVIRGATSRLETLALDAALEAAGMAVTLAEIEDSGPAARAATLRQAAFDADAGVTSVDIGVAETGTLALLARRGQGRAVSLLPPVHIAVLWAADIVGELAALVERATASGEDLPSALTLITGPSRTGDIELVLTVGVHGPRELHLVVVG